jgi:hypothetical protein
VQVQISFVFIKVQKGGKKTWALKKEKEEEKKKSKKKRVLIMGFVFLAQIFFLV